MADNIAFDFEALDFESAVDEVDIIVPKYLESLEHLEHVKDLEHVPTAVQNVVVYWERLDLLFRQIEPLEHEVPFRQIMTDALQSELGVLERVYLAVNLRIQFKESQWNTAMWNAAEALLERMDKVLEGLGFPEDHEDRLLASELQVKNRELRVHWEQAQDMAS